MTDRTGPGDQPSPKNIGNQGEGGAPGAGSTGTTNAPTQSADAHALGPRGPVGPPGPPGSAYSWKSPHLIGVVFLGIVAVACIYALIQLSDKPQDPGVPPTDAQAAAQGEQPTAAGPVAVQVAEDTGSLGLLGQIVGILGTVAAAAVGGIAGLLTGSAGASRSGTNQGDSIAQPGQT
jgi:hypothetical protein